MHDRFIIFLKYTLTVSCGIPVVVYVSGSAEETKLKKKELLP
jgi:hypothetical protein